MICQPKIGKWSGPKSRSMCERIGERFPCKHYRGCYCCESNHCAALENPRGGDFGWGECIHSVQRGPGIMETWEYIEIWHDYCQKGVADVKNEVIGCRSTR